MVIVMQVISYVVYTTHPSLCVCVCAHACACVCVCVQPCYYLTVTHLMKIAFLSLAMVS